MKRRPGSPLFLGIAFLGITLMIRIVSAQDSSGDQVLSRFDRMVQYNLDNACTLPSAVIDSMMASIQDRPVGERIAFWANALYRDGRGRYVFGLDPEGYVTEGRIVDDFRTDCVLFLYRVTELGRSASAREAVQFAFGTRFFGASVADAILDNGRVRYDHPSHLDYSEDILKSGIWGKDVTATIGPIEKDPGTTRIAADSFSYVPKALVNGAALHSGDIIFFVTDEKNPKGIDTRSRGGLIGHIGILTLEGGDPYLIHAAKTPLAGFYDGGKIEKVPLKAYLDRMDSFKGIAVTRIEEF